MPETQADNVTAAPSERRQAPRVVAGRPGRMRLTQADQHLVTPCSIVDISQSGCRLTLSRSALPRDWSWASGSGCSLEIMLKGHEEILLAGQVVWSQRMQAGFDLLGLRFLNPPPAVSETIDHFVLQRLHVGLKIQEKPDTAKPEATLLPLEVPLEVEGRLREDPDAPPYRLAAFAVGGDILEANYAPKEGETKRVPPSGAALDLSVLPPTWARGEKRTLRFVAHAVHVDHVSVRLNFHAEGSDLAQMIRDLIPPKIQRAKKPTEVDYSLVLLLIAAVIIGLIIAHISGG